MLPGHHLSNPGAINARGQVVGLSCNTTIGGCRPFLWSGVLDALPFLPGSTFTAALGINDAGEAVGQSSRPDENGEIDVRAVRWDRTRAISDLGVGSFAGAQDINNAGQVVGVYGGGGFLWENGRLVNLGQVPNGTSQFFPLAVNDRGEIAGQGLSFFGTHAYRWKDGVIEDLGTLGGIHSLTRAHDINDLGHIVGFSGFRAFLWQGGGIRDLAAFPEPGGTGSSVALAINNLGQVVGASGMQGEFVGRGAIWLEGQIFDLNTLIPADSGWHVAEAVDINEAGQIVAIGYRLPLTDHDSGTRDRALLLTPDPCRDTDGNGNNDNDGDGLCDDWEIGGIDGDGDGIIDLPLHRAPYNADPNHKDLFVEVDYMDCAQGGCSDGHDHWPDAAALSRVRVAFAGAPIDNPDGIQGVKLHLVDEPEAVRHLQQVIFDVGPLDPNASADGFFDDLKLGHPLLACDGHFGTPEDRAHPDCTAILAARRLAFRYVIFGHDHAHTLGSSGKAEIGGNDFLVTLGSTGGNGTAEQQAATFMHELGHTLGLFHGGGDPFNCKPNYLSVMNYSFQFEAFVATRRLDYSDTALPTLDERHLSEPGGIAGPSDRRTLYGIDGVHAETNFNAAVDWNIDGDPSDTDVSADVNRIDAIGACRGSSDLHTIHTRAIKISLTNNLDESIVPEPGAFAVKVNGDAPVAPAAVSIRFNVVRLRLAAPVSRGDAVTVDYTRPAAGGLEFLAVPENQPVIDFNVSLTNTTEDPLTGFDDWANLDYDFRDSPEFADGAPRTTPVEVEEMTTDEVRAAARTMDSDGDGVSNADDPCPAEPNGCGEGSPPDTTPPLTTASTSPPPNANGWNKEDVTVTFFCADGLSGIEACGPTPQVVSTEGAGQSRSATAVDLAGNSASATVGGINIDKTAPVVACSASPGSLWPPNHELVPVELSVVVTDAPSGSAGFELTGSSSSEPDNGLGDGDTAGDIQGFELGAAEVNGWLRAERSGLGAGRVYTLGYRGMDRAGNAASCQATVNVAHNQ